MGPRMLSQSKLGVSCRVPFIRAPYHSGDKNRDPHFENYSSRI